LEGGWEYRHKDVGIFYNDRWLWYQLINIILNISMLNNMVQYLL